MKLRHKSALYGVVSIVLAVGLGVATLASVYSLSKLDALSGDIRRIIIDVRQVDTLASEYALTRTPRTFLQWDGIHMRLEGDFDAFAPRIDLAAGQQAELVERLSTLDRSFRRLRDIPSGASSEIAAIFVNRIRANTDALASRLQVIESDIQRRRDGLLDLTIGLVAAAVLAFITMAGLFHALLRGVFLRAFDEVDRAIHALDPGRRMPEITTDRRDEVGDLIRETEKARRVISDAFRAQEDARLRAEELSQAKSSFVTTVSHELRTPLNGLLGSIELAMEARDPDVRWRYHDVARQSGWALLDVINNVLDLSKIEGGALGFERTGFLPEKIIAHVHSITQPELKRKRLAFEVETDIERGTVLLGDPLRIQQILINLVGNAVKFTTSGGVTISARLNESEHPAVEPEGIGAPSHTLEIAVTDTGVGIASDRHELVFESFAQLDNSISRKFGGSGLGLTISRKLARGMGGELTVESVLGRGSTFTLTVPVRVGHASDLAPRDEAAPLQDSVMGPLRVLLVDDSEINRMIAAQHLKGWGCVVTEAGDGRSAVALAGAQEFDVVLMDVQMPEMDGVEATQTIRSLGVVVPIFGVTANAFSEQRDAYIDAGMNDVINKPVDWAALRRSLQRLQPSAPATLASVERIADARRRKSGGAAGNVARLRPSGGDATGAEYANVIAPIIADGAYQEIDRDVLEGLFGILPEEKVFNLCRRAIEQTEALGRDIRLAENREQCARHLHTIKGMASSVGLERIAAYAESMEKRSGILPQEEIAGTILRFAEHARQAVHAFMEERAARETVRLPD